jgi:hypothetical protein
VIFFLEAQQMLLAECTNKDEEIKIIKCYVKGFLKAREMAFDLYISYEEEDLNHCPILKIGEKEV